jgi:hypothetical protein
MHVIIVTSNLFCLSAYFFPLGTICFLYPFHLRFRLTTGRSAPLNGSPYAESNNRASAAVIAVVLMLISKPGNRENESKFARQSAHVFGGGGSYFQFEERGQGQCRGIQSRWYQICNSRGSEGLQSQGFGGGRSLLR